MSGLSEAGGRRRVSFRGADVLVAERGHGDPIGFVHGMLGCPVDHPLLDTLAQRGRVIAPSLPGCTGSPPCDDIRSLYDWVAVLSEVIDLSGLAGQRVVASSTGAMLALELAAVRPDAFAELTVLAPVGLWDADDPVTDPFCATLSGQRALLTEDPQCTAPFFDDDPSRTGDDAVEDGVVRYTTRTAAASLVWPIPEFGLASRLHLVRCPVRIVWGGADRIVSSRYAPRFASRLSDVVGVHVLEGVGHLVDWEAPESVAALVADA